jgi:SNF2 family DNA or RNA helicase
MTYSLRATQNKEAEFWAEKKRVFNTSDPGTGKTLATLEGYKRSIKGRLLVSAPLSILRPSWGQDIDKFMPGFSWAVAHGSPKKREQAFASGADVVLINHDGIKWLAENLRLLEGFSHGCTDEFTCYKNRTTKRSKAALRVFNEIEYLSLLSGTPNSNTVLDLWHPAFMVDHGQRLGADFWKFRSQVCTPQQVGPDPKHVQWIDKDGAVAQVTALLSDITVRHELTDVPENILYNMYVDMPAQIMAQYRELEKDAVLALEGGIISAVNAGVKTKKMLQLLSGAAYDSAGQIVKVHPHRHQLVTDLILAREQCVVAFNFSHERDGLIDMAKKAGITYGVIDGSVPVAEREKIVDEFQRGLRKVVYCHPQSAGHGLTMTAGTTTIWCSPTYNAEHFKQFNRRIHRTGQTRKTETICICATNTKEEEVYAALNGKLTRMEDLLAIFSNLTSIAA